MSRKLYVGNMPFQAEDEDLKNFFSTIGEVVSVKIIVDLQTGHFERGRGGLGRNKRSVHRKG